MPINPHRPVDAGQAPSRGLALFAGYADALGQLRDYRAALGSAPDRTWLLHFVGPPGIGKSSLLAQFAATAAPKESSRLATASFDVDSFDPRTSAPDALWSLRFALRRATVPTPLFDLYYVSYFTRFVMPGVVISLPTLLSSLGARAEPIERLAGIGSDKGLAEYLDATFDAEVFKDLAEGAADLARSLKSAQLLIKLAQAFKKHAARKRLKREGFDPAKANLETMLAIAPEVLAADLIAFAGKGVPLLIAIDALDRIQADPQAIAEATPAERALETLLRFLMFADPAPGAAIRFVTFGRERLRWHELFDDEDATGSWDELIRQVPLTGLDAAAAQALVRQADSLLDAAGETAAAQALRASAAQILTVSRDDAASPGADRYSPLRLRLCIEEIRERRRPLNERSAARHAKNIFETFLRSVPPALKQAIHVIALTGWFDRRLFEALVTEHLVGGFAISDFDSLVARDALFVRAGDGEHYRLHDQLERALIALLARDAGATERYQQTIWRMHTLRLARATAGGFAALSLRHIDAYAQGMRQIFRLHEAHLLPIDVFAVFFLELEYAIHLEVGIAGELHASFLTRLFRLSEHWSEAEGRCLVNSPLRTRANHRARALLKLIEVHFLQKTVDQAALAAARHMFTRMYEAGVLPPTDAAPVDRQVLSWMQAVQMRAAASQLADEGHAEESEAMLRETLARLPAELALAQRSALEGEVYCDLAVLRGRLRDRAGAEALLGKALAVWTAARPPALPGARQKLRYCLLMLTLVGKPDPAAEMLRGIAQVLESGLPAGHPERGDLAFCLATLFMLRGTDALAIPYLRTAHDIRVANHGDDDPRTIRLGELIRELAARTGESQVPDGQAPTQE